MKKAFATLVVLVALIAAAAGLGPLYTSRLVDRQLTTLVAQIDHEGVFAASYAPGAKGWFSQQDTITLTPVDKRLTQLEQGRQQPIVLHLHVAYGPLPFAAWRRDGVSLMPVGAVVDTRVAGLDRLLSQAGSSYQVRDVVTLTGGNTFTLRVSPGHMTDQQGAVLNWAGSELILNATGSRLNGHGRSGVITVSAAGASQAKIVIDPVAVDIPHLRMVNGQAVGKVSVRWGGMHANNLPEKNRPPMDVALEGMAMSLDTHMVQGIAAGKGTLTLAGLTVRPAAADAGPAFSLHRLSLSSSTTDPSQGYTDSSVVWNVQRIDVGGSEYSPALLAVRLDHLYVPALIDAMRTLREAQPALQAQNGEPPRLAMQRLLGLITPSAQSMLAHRPVLHLVGLHLGTPQGALDGSGDAELEPSGGATPSLTTLPDDLVAHLTLNLPTSLARELAAMMLARQGVPADQLAQDAQQYLGALAAQGLLRSESAGYAVDLVYRHGQVTVNGRPLGAH
ncbi:hypothetical protein BJI67_00930 [Acidihalobacter aeolianus]|uniref:DUF945 domain-containing protein n=1 Tax=Acidihalobacter aeolianus TaxID=2792603 RepID=A0A1D8K4C7_9GAMM|nr:DUF945 family protein [Acidihalobacter aeolianus]AOV15818.1 hypothetical protein BJI67_00930 [Acidihalobacter aeolianus]